MELALGVGIALLLTFSGIASAQTAPWTPDEGRTFVDLNLVGLASSSAKPRELSSRFVTFGEAGSAKATYPTPSRTFPVPLIDAGGGYMAKAAWLGLGVHVTRISFEDGADLAVTVPHPTFLSAPASATGRSDRELTRTETALHVFIAVVPLRTARMEVRIFSGPSFFRLKANMVQSVLYTQTYDAATPQSAVTVTGVSTTNATGHGIGFHAGGDVSYFVTRRIGVRGGVRYSQANVTVNAEPLSQLSQDIRVGGTLVFLGVRLRFGE